MDIASLVPRASRAVTLSPWLTGPCRRMVLNHLSGLEGLGLTLKEDDQERVITTGEPDVTVRVHNPRTYSSLITRGRLGAAEAYLRGWWEADDLVDLLQGFARQRSTRNQLNGGLNLFIQPLRKLNHWLRRNTLGQSRENIQAHYDLGNDFYEQILDPTMNYSCAEFKPRTNSLEQASRQKMDTILEKLEPTPQDHVLEIGTGWGGLALHLARETGCKVTTTTLSENQFEYARKRVQREGLEDQVTVLKQDYRELSGQYDHVVSIEMVEAVGARYLGRYLRTCDELLKPGGRFLLQAILIRDDLYEEYRRNVDFIRAYVFPGGSLPALKTIQYWISEVTNLQLIDLQDLRQDYVRTLRAWRSNFQDNYRAIRSLDYQEEFLRLWTYYLAYCEAGFSEATISDQQFLYERIS